MIKRFLNVLICLLFSLSLFAQVELVPLEDEVEMLYDNISNKPLSQIKERKAPDSLVNALKGNEAFWYANATPVKKETKDYKRKLSTAWLQEKWVRILFWVLFIGGFASVLIWYLTTLNIKLFSKSALAIPATQGQLITEDIFSIDYDKEIKNAVQAQNFKQAVRLYYLQTLSLLSGNGYIQFQQDRTNSVYLRQLYNKAPYQSFRNLTHIFEYTCYGKFELNQPAFEKVQKDFETFYQHHLS